MMRFIGYGAPNKPMQRMRKERARHQQRLVRAADWRRYVAFSCRTYNSGILSLR